jgi:DNA-binding response OmpR family regulator
MPRILLVDDDAPFLDGLVLSFEQAGYEVRSAVDGTQALELLASEKVDCVVADVNMPRLDGFTLCRRMRHGGDESPVILLTSRDGEIDEALGLELGADDYISKPVGMRVLLARVEAVMRRARPRDSEQQDAVVVRGALELEPARYRVTYAGSNLPVTVTEFKLVEALSSRPGLVWSRDRLLEVIREDGTTVAPRIIDTYVGRLRKKLGEIDPNSYEIETVVGAGYRWRDAP